METSCRGHKDPLSILLLVTVCHSYILSMRDERNDDALTEMLLFDGKSRVDDSVELVLTSKANSRRTSISYTKPKR